MDIGRRITRAGYVLAIVAMAVGLIGCDAIVSIWFDSDTPPIMEKEISIGVVSSLTGPYAEPYGLPMLRGFEMARDDINKVLDLTGQFGDARLTFITVDDMSTVDGAKAAVEELVNQEVSAIVGIPISTHLKAAVPIAQENQIVAFSSLSTAAGLSGIGDYIFRVALATDILMPSGVMATHAKLGYQKVAMIYDQIDVYSTSSYEELRKALEANGVEILTVESFQTGDTDFSAQLRKIKGLNPDALFISALAQEVTEIMIQGRALGIPASVHFIVPELSRYEVQKAGDAAEGVITFISWSRRSETPGNQDFVQNYQARYGIEPEPWAAQSYAALHILTDAIARAESTDSTAIRDALAQTVDYPTILGNFSFDPNGEAMYAPIVLIARAGTLHPFE